MIDTTGVQGIVVARLWDPQQFDNYRRHKGIIIADEMLKEGIIPEQQIVTKNKVTDNGLNWIRAQIVPALDTSNIYKSKMGEMGLVSSSASLSNIFPVKKLVITSGFASGQTVQDAWWDTTEANDYTIDCITIYTYTDTTTPAGAKAWLYAAAKLPNPVLKRTSIPQTLTITRYETFVKN